VAKAAAGRSPRQLRILETASALGKRIRQTIGQTLPPTLPRGLCDAYSKPAKTETRCTSMLASSSHMK
jgi:hypothetical protein